MRGQVWIKKGVVVMTFRNIVSVLAGIAAFLVIGGMFSLLPSATGRVSAYQRPATGQWVIKSPDPGTRYINVDEGVCVLYLTRPTTFYGWVSRHCQDTNMGRPKSEADCRRQAELDAKVFCTPETGVTGVVTGMIAVDSESCAGLAGKYDGVVEKEVSVAVSKPTAMINPCNGRAEVSARKTSILEMPERVFERNVFPDGDVVGKSEDVSYALCVDGNARVVVSGVVMCDDLG